MQLGADIPETKRRAYHASAICDLIPSGEPYRNIHRQSRRIYRQHQGKTFQRFAADGENPVPPHSALSPRRQHKSMFGALRILALSNARSMILRRFPLVMTCCRAMVRRLHGMGVEAGTRRLAMNPNARARRDRRSLRESRAAGQQGQDSSDRKDSTGFHGNLPLLNRIRRPARRMTVRSSSCKRTSAAKFAKEGSEILVLFCLVLRDDDRSRRAEQISKADADRID